MKRLANFAVWIVCAFCALYFWAHLNLTASFLLAFMFSATLDAAATAEKKPTFMPHYVKFSPDVYKMLLDLGLVTPDIWRTVFEETATTDAWRGDYVCRRGIYAYGLFWDAEQNTIVHWPKLGIYTEGYSASVELDNFPQNDGAGGAFSDWNPRLIIRRTMRGYGIGIDVLHNWWEAIGSKLPAVAGLHHDTDHMIGRTVVYFADIPHQIFWELSSTESVVKPADMKSVLESSGWTQSDDSHLLEIRHLHPHKDYTHKYANLNTNFVHHLR